MRKYFKPLRGFTLIEALIALNLIGISIYFGSTTIGQLTKIKVNAQLYMNVNLAKRNLLSIIQNNTAWLYSINGNGNEFDCLKNITGSVADPGCETKNDLAGYPFILRNDSNQVYYDPINSPTAGFDNAGEVCNTFDSINGNPSCPYRASIRWRPHCNIGAGDKCHQPAIEIFGEIQIKRSSSLFNIQKNNYSFQIIRPFVNCPAQVVDIRTSSLQWQQTPPASAGIINGLFLTKPNTPIATDIGFVYQTQIFSCDDQVLNFKQRMNFIGAAAKDDPENISSVCISDPNDSNNCLFEWRHHQSSWSLWQKSGGILTKVYDMPIGPRPRFDETTVFTFQTKKGLVEFYVDSEIYYVFSETWPRNYSIKILPPPGNYSLGIEPF